MIRKKISRRNFINKSTCAAMGSLPFLSGILDLKMINSLAAQPALINNDYKALVCISFYGGIDSFNMLVPRGMDEYGDYESTRGTLALVQSDLLAINPINNTSGKTYGLHPSLTGVQQLFESENLAFVANVGTLVEPIEHYDNYLNANYIKPDYLYSHADQFRQWQTSVPTDRNASGWGGRIADIVNANYNQSNVSMNISLSGYNIFQNSEFTSQYSISRTGNGAINLNYPYSPQNAGFIQTLQNTALNNHLEATYSNIFEQTLSTQLKSTIENNEYFSDKIANQAPISTSFSNTVLSSNLNMVARTIRAQMDLSMNRQIFFINFGNFDTHSHQASKLAEQLDEIDTALTEFYTALEEIGMADKVTTFTMSDFGRTLTGNGSIGSDHAWAGHHLVMGGAVNGKNIYGTYPDLRLENNPLIVNARGVMIPTTSTDEYFSEMALWFGVSLGDLMGANGLFPNLGNFYSPDPSMGPLGFMNL